LGRGVGLISEKLAEFYTRAEDKYFDLLDFLDSKGLPVYTYSDFFEKKGIPSFVVTVAIILLILVLCTVVLTYKGAGTGELTLSLKDKNGGSLNGVDVLITDGKGEILFQGKANDGQKIPLKRALYDTEQIKITANKEGYQSFSRDFTIGELGGKAAISFSKAYEGIEAQILIVDNEWNTKVTGATVIAATNEQSFQFDEDTNGLYMKAGVPAGITMLLKVSAEGYDDYSENVIFKSEEVRTVELTPSTQGFRGKATVQVVVNGSDGKAINQAKVTIISKENGAVLLSDYTAQGSIVGEIQAGIPLKLVIEKQGYLTYDSDKLNESITIRKKEEQIMKVLQQGGQDLRVTVSDADSGFAISDATVTVFHENGEKLDEKITTISGADFTGLDPSETVYFTAYKEGYLPSREQVLVGATEEVKLVLAKVNAVNSTRLDIYTIDSKAYPVNGATINVYEITDGNKAPYGMQLETSFDGYISAVVATGKTYELTANTTAMEGKTNVETKQGEVSKKVYITMNKKENIIEMHFIDIYGKDIYGTAVISALDGKELYDGNIVKSSIFFDAEQRDVVEVQVTTPDGNLFTENVTIKGKDYVEVVVFNKESNELAPLIEPAGIEDEAGSEAQGITPGAFYWVKFNVTFPSAATSGGVHFRAGADNVEFAESEKFGIYDLSAQGAQTEYSYSYTPAPAPGNEVVDRANAGQQGQKNKWVEGTINQPQGTYLIKVKVRAEDFTSGKVELRYRAWSIVQGDYYRAPEDLDLGTKPSSETKAGLYAQTTLLDLKLYESLPSCTENVCLSVNFVDAQERYIEEKGFQAIKDKVYGIEAEVTALESDYVNISVSSDSNVEFISTQTSNFNFTRETEETSTGQSTAEASVSLNKDGKQKMRFYFKAKQLGPAKITVKASGKTEAKKDVLFNVVQEKLLLVELSESQVMPGRNFTVKVTDEGLKGVENALVKIIDKEGKVVKSISGSGTDGKGKNGYYRVQNDLSPGLYTVEVSAPTYATKALPLLISTKTTLTFPNALEAKMLFNQRTIMIPAELANNSDFTVQNISVQTQGENEKSMQLGQEISTTQSGLFKLTISVPPALSANQKQAVEVTVAYLGELSGTADETAKIIISGMVEGKFLTKVESSIHMVYNRKLDPGCLRLEPSSITINLLGNQGSTGNEVVEATNNCDQALTLTKRPRKTSGDSFVRVDSEDVDLQPGETKNILITATNTIDRGAAREQVLGYEIVYSDQNTLTKRLGVNVKIINPVFALSYPPQISLWLAQSSISEKAQAAQPIFVTNISSFPVENITFSPDREYGSGSNIQFRVAPPGAVNLERGQTMAPPKLVTAEANSKVTEPVRGRIVINGRMGQLNNRARQRDGYDYYNDYANGTKPLAGYAPQTSNYYDNSSSILGIIEIIAMYSGYNCLKVYALDDEPLDYRLGNLGQMGKRIKVRNTCAESVRLTGAQPAGSAKQPRPIIGLPVLSTQVIMSVPQVSVMPGQEAILPFSIITRIPSMKAQNYKVVLMGVTEMSGTPINSDIFSINIYSGIDLASEHTKAISIKVKLCDASGKEESVNVPKVSSTYPGNCAEGYCDAKAAAGYIAEKIRQIIDNARSKGYTKVGKESDTGCEDQGYCSFTQLGILPATFDLYLQNDAVTADLMQSILNKSENTASSSPFREEMGATEYMVVPMGVEASTIGKLMGYGYDRAVFLDNTLAGCGYYKIQIDGAFRTTVDPSLEGGRGIDIRTPIISIRAMATINGGKKLITNECIESITNVANFNPVDQGLEAENSKGTWLTTIETDPALKDVAKAIATTRLRSDKRITLGSGNKIKLVQTALSSGMAEMCLQGGERKTILVKIDPNLLKSNDSKDNGVMAQTIAAMVSDALNGSFGQNCVTKTGDVYACVRLIDSERAKRKIGIQMPAMLPINKNGGCIGATVYSNVGEKLDFDVTPITIKHEFEGVRKIEILADDTKQVPRFAPQQATVADQATANPNPQNAGNPGQGTSTVGKDNSTATPKPSPRTGSNSTKQPSGAPNPNPASTPTNPLQTPEKPNSVASTQGETNNVVNKVSFAADAGDLQVGSDTIKSIADAENSQAGTDTISFADSDATGAGTSSPGTIGAGAPSIDAASTTRTPVDITIPYVVYEDTGKGLAKVTDASRAMELHEMPRITEYKYYRNIQICVRTNTPEQTALNTEQSERARQAYVQANGNQFEVGVYNASLGETTVKPEAKQIITITTGTLHPTDLLDLILRKKLEENKPMYFIAAWQGEPNQIYLNVYKEALLRQGIFDDTTSTGNEKSEKVESLEKNGRASAINAYALTCLGAAFLCNLPGGPLNATASAAADCGTPLFTTLRKETLQTSWGEKAGQGIQGVWNGFVGLMESVGKVIGFKDLKFDNLKLDFFKDKQLDTKSNAPDSIKAEVIAEGAAAGFAVDLTRTLFWNKRLGAAINPMNIGATAEDLAALYSKKAEEAILASLTKEARSAKKSKITAFTSAYKTEIKKVLTAALNDKYKAATTRSKNPIKFMLGIYAQPEVVDLKTTVEQVIKEKANDLDVSKFLSKKAGSSAQTYMQSIFGENPTAMKEAVAKGTSAQKILEQKLGKTTTELDNMVNSSLDEAWFDKAEDGLKKKISVKAGDLDSAIARMVDDSVEGISAADKEILANKIKARLLGASDSAIAKAAAEKDPVKALKAIIAKQPEMPITANTYKEIVGKNGVKGYVLDKAAPLGTTRKELIGKISSAGKGELEQFMLKTGKAKELAEQLGKGIDDLVKAGAAKEAGTATKLSAWERFKSKFSRRALGSIAWGVFCGAGANVLGMAAYNSKMETTAKQLNEQLFDVPDVLIEKGKKYKITVYPIKKGTSIVPVEEKSDEMTAQVNGVSPKMLTSQPDSKGRAPEERPLDAYPIITSRTKLRDAIATTKGYKDAYSASGKEQIIDMEPFKIYMNKDIQKLVFMYTGARNLDCTVNTGAIKAPDKTATARVEPLAFALLTTKASDSEYNWADIEKEAKNPRSGWLWNKLNLAMEKRTSASNQKMTEAVAKQIFPNEKDPAKITRFVQDVAFWEGIYDSSPPTVVNFCQNQVK
jgi:hypothetical protein